jgi:hypothetical protein
MGGKSIQPRCDTVHHSRRRFRVTMYAASSSRLLSARASHLTRTASPLPHHRTDFLFAGEISGLSLFEGGFNLPDLPFIQVNVGADRFSREVGFGAIHRLGEFFKPQLGFRSTRIVITSDILYCLVYTAIQQDPPRSSPKFPSNCMLIPNHS